MSSGVQRGLNSFCCKNKVIGLFLQRSCQLRLHVVHPFIIFPGGSVCDWVALIKLKKVFNLYVPYLLVYMSLPSSDISVPCSAAQVDGCKNCF